MTVLALAEKLEKLKEPDRTVALRLSKPSADTCDVVAHPESGR